MEKFSKGLRLCCLKVRELWSPENKDTVANKFVHSGEQILRSQSKCDQLCFKKSPVSGPLPLGLRTAFPSSSFFTANVLIA